MSLEPVLEVQRNKAILLVAKEMAQGLEEAPFINIPNFCREKQLAIYDNKRAPKILEDARTACEKKAATVYEPSGLRHLEEEIAALLKQPDTIQALTENNFFELHDLPNIYFGNELFSGAQNKLNSARTSANAELEPKRLKAFETAEQSIKAILDEQQQVAAYCGQIQQSFDTCLNKVRAICSQKMSEIATNRRAARCDARWDNIKAQKGFREGNIVMPFGEPTSIEKLVCSQDFDQLGLKVEDNSGLFSSEYLLTREETFGGTPVRFTAILTQSFSAANQWALSSPTLNGSPLNNSTMKTSSDFMQCAIYLEQCFRNN